MPGEERERTAMLAEALLAVIYCTPHGSLPTGVEAFADRAILRATGDWPDAGDNRETAAEIVERLKLAATKGRRHDEA